MHLQRILCIVAAALALADALPDRYFCSTFSAATAGGAQGYLAVRVRDTDASYGVSMDWTNFASCNPTVTPINYHIHTMWTSMTSDVGVNGTACGSSITGGHYDPTLQCTSASQFSSTLCRDLSRDGNQYNCTPDLYSQGYWEQCELGDISAKHGALSTLRTSVFFTDVWPINVVDYGVGGGNGWASVVFHCGSPRVLCGRMVEVSSWMACTGSAFPSSGAASAPVAMALGLLALLAMFL